MCFFDLSSWAKCIGRKLKAHAFCRFYGLKNARIAREEKIFCKIKRWLLTKNN